MQLKQVIILGLVQGLFEFLPVSSSGHLALARFLMGVKIDVPLALDVTLHIGTLLSVIVFLRMDIMRVVKDDFRGLFIAFIFTLPVAASLEEIAQKVSLNLVLLGGAFMLGAPILFLSKLRGRMLNEFLAFAMIGLSQGISTLPGVSRSGSTISVAMLSGFSHNRSFNFSFVLALPTIIAAIFYEFVKHPEFKPGIQEIVGGSVAFIVGLMALYLLRRIVIRGKLHLFSVYLFLVGITSLVIGLGK